MATKDLIVRSGVLALALAGAGCVSVTVAAPEALRAVQGEAISGASRELPIAAEEGEGEYCTDMNGDPVLDGEWGPVRTESGKITMQLCLNGIFVDSEIEEANERREGWQRLQSGTFVIDLPLFERVVRAILADIEEKGGDPDSWYLLRHPGENQQIVRDGYRWEYRKGLWVRCRLAPQPSQQ